MQTLSHLTNQELIAQLTLRDDLTDLEFELLDRLVRATDEVDRLDIYQAVRSGRMRTRDLHPG